MRIKQHTLVNKDLKAITKQTIPSNSEATSWWWNPTSQQQDEKGRGYGGKVTLTTCLTDLRPGASFHAVIVDLPSKEPEWVWSTSIPGTVNTFLFTVTLGKYLERKDTKVTTDNSTAWGNSRQSDPHARAGIEPEINSKASTHNCGYTSEWPP